MAIYKYTAKNISGHRISGQIKAQDEGQVYQHIKNSGLYMTSIKQVNSQSRTKTLRSAHLSAFAGQLSIMLRSGIALVQAMNIVVQRENKAALAQLYRNVYQMLLRGTVLSDAMEAQAGVFPELLVNMVRAGEAGGQLANTMQNMAAYYEKDNRLKKKIAGALVYPLFLMILIIVAVVIIFTVVMPTFFDLFNSMEALPANTRFLIWVSNTMVNNAPMLIAFVAVLIFAIVKIAEIPMVSSKISKLKVHLPVIGSLLKTIYTARFARALSSLYSSGVSLVEAIRISSSIISNEYVEEQFKSVLEDVKNGIPLSAAIKDVDGLDSKLTTNIYIGEESGKLNIMLDNIAETFDEEADEATKRLTTLVEPVMIVIMAVIVGYIMLSVLVPIYQYYQTLSV